MNRDRKPPFQFGLKGLLSLITLAGACLAAFRWMPAELRFYVFVPLALSVAIVLATFLLGTLIWLLMEAFRKIVRRFDDR